MVVTGGAPAREHAIRTTGSRTLRRRTGLVWILNWRRVSLILVPYRGSRERQNTLIDCRLRPVELDCRTSSGPSGGHPETRLFSDIHLPTWAVGFSIPDTIT